MRAKQLYFINNHEVCPDVCIEPELQPVDRFTSRYATANVEDHSRVDVRAKGFWSSRHQSAFLI